MQLERPELSAVVAKPSVVASQTRFRCETTRGDFEVELRPDLAPHGAKRVRDMMEVGFFNQGIAFFRVNDWITQFGADQLPGNRKDGDPFMAVRSDPKRDVHPDLVVNNSTTPTSLTPWVRGTFALIGETQMVVVIRPNPHMGKLAHDAPAGYVTKGMDTVFDHLYRYNDLIDNPKGDPGPRQEEIFKEGIEYIYREFPKTDVIQNCFFLRLPVVCFFRVKTRADQVHVTRVCS
jgi:cyclophilin family peptidyl-prolyl cis-trans isomerase